MVTDPIADMLIHIKNASMAGQADIAVPYSKLKEEIAKILEKEGYVAKVGKNEEARPSLMISLKYENKRPVITNIRRESKPGLRRYVRKNSIPQVLGGSGLAILSTPAGIMTGTEAKKRGIGGELLCVIW